MLFSPLRAIYICKTKNLINHPLTENTKLLLTAMKIKLNRYYGDEKVTKSTAEVYMDGQTEPVLTFETREVGYADYTAAFPGCSSLCLPSGTYPLAVGSTPYGPMGLRVPKCPGHRCYYIGHRWDRQAIAGELLVGEPYTPSLDLNEGIYLTEEEDRAERVIVNGAKIYDKLDSLVYQAYANNEDFTIEISNYNLKRYRLFGKL